MRAGNFSGYPAVIYDPTTYNAATNTRTPFQGNVIPAGEIDPIAKNLLAVFPLPNLPGLTNNLRVNPLSVDVQDQFDVRGDQVSRNGTACSRDTRTVGRTSPTLRRR